MTEFQKQQSHGNFNFFYPAISDLVVIEPKVYGDSRGFFLETFNDESFSAAGVPTSFKQDNHSFSTKGVLRGLHIQNPTFQGKLVRCTRGKVFDVAVDLRKDSPTFGQHFGLVLDSVTKNMMYVPEGFAHGFLALEDCEFLYKCTQVWKPSEDLTVGYDSLTIPWLRYADMFGIKEFTLSPKDIQKAISVDQYRFMYLR